MASLANRTYVVTGGFSGIGLATVRKLLARSATVHVIDYSSAIPPELTSKSSSTSTQEGAAFAYPGVDVSSRPSIYKAFDSIVQHSPQISGLVNSAGICPSSCSNIESEEVFDETIAINLKGTWNMTNVLVRHVLNSNSSTTKSEPHTWEPGRPAVCSIVNVGSSASYYGYETLAAYTASKHAVLGLTRSWALDFAAHGIRSNLVAPGGTNTPLSKAQFDDKERGDMSRAVYPLIPMKRFAEPEEVADGIIFLLGEESSYITGQILKINGGWP